MGVVSHPSRPTVALASVAVPGIDAVDRAAILRAVAGELAAAAGGVKPEEIERRLAERERLGSTVVADGVAMPHCRCLGIERAALAIVRTRRPVAFDGQGGEVRLILGLVTPAGPPAEHLRALAELSRRIRDEERLSALLAAPTADAMLRVWAGAA